MKSEVDYPKLSLTTISLNADKHIERCFKSVESQKVRPDEYIVIDGKSKDKTSNIIQKYYDRNVITNFILEPDNGISDAFNKAWRFASCDYVAIINSDDAILPEYVEEIKKAILFKPDIIICNIKFIASHKETLLLPKFEYNRPIKNWYPPQINHAGMVIKKSILETLNGYNCAYKVAMDVEIFYRVLDRNPNIMHINKCLVAQYDGGFSRRNWLIALIELCRLEIQYKRNFLICLFSFIKRAFFTLLLKLAKNLIRK